jgi:hypothetical protein
MEHQPHEQASEYDRRQVSGTGPYHVEVAAGLHEVRLPELCASCAAPPVGTLPLTKLFRRTYSDSPTQHLFGTVHVPFCLACLQAHEAERRAPDPVVLRRLRNRWLLRCLPYVIPVVVLTFLLGRILPSALDAVTAANRVELLVWVGVVGFLALCLFGFVRLILNARRDLVADFGGAANDQYAEVVRGPLGITCVLPGPPTRPMSAVNFADENVELLGRNRRTFTFANVDVATAFAAANAELVWQPNSPRAVRLRWANRVLIGLVLGVGLVLLLRDLFGV